MEQIKQALESIAAAATFFVIGVLVLEGVFPGSVARWVSLPGIVFGSATIAVLGFFFEKRP